MEDNNPILVTGAAGFIGFHLAKRLLEEGNLVVGLDNLNEYYDVQLKKARLQKLEGFPTFRFQKSNIADQEAMALFFKESSFGLVLHMAAQAGVRYSLSNPNAYVESNLIGFANILEGCRRSSVKHLVFASSSSVYGANTKMPFSVRDNVDHPLSLYAATKRSNELMAHSYAHLYALPCTGLRFFTVYGPWGRPDMALFLFIKAILEERPIDVFNDGKMQRDFTYIDDIVEGVLRISRKIPEPVNYGRSDARFRVFNIGRQQPVDLMKVIEILEKELGRKAEKRFLPLQPGDVPATFADVSDLSAVIGFEPRISIEEGVSRFVKWYRGFYFTTAKGGMV